jgi:CRP/FNR family transcriptional regulator, anaerobic regulatory protein
LPHLLLTNRTRGDRSRCAQCRAHSRSICAALDAADLQEFEKLGRETRLAAREPLFLEDEVAEAVFNVTVGVVRLCKPLPDGRRQVIGFALPGDFLGAALGDRHTFSACAVGPVTVCKTSRISFWQFVGSQTGILRRMNEFAARELDQAQEQMLLLGRRTAEEKVASFLVGWRDRLVRAGGSAATIPLPMSRQDIADFLGLTIETVSRTLTKLERDGVIAIIRGGVRLCDIKRAEAIAAAWSVSA